MGGVCCPCWRSHDYTEIPTSNPVEIPHHKKKKDYHVAFQNDTTIVPDTEMNLNTFNHQSQETISPSTLPSSFPKSETNNRIGNNVNNGNGNGNGNLNHNILLNQEEDEDESKDYFALEVVRHPVPVPAPPVPTSPQVTQDSPKLITIPDVDDPFPEDIPQSPDFLSLDLPQDSKTEELCDRVLPVVEHQEPSQEISIPQNVADDIRPEIHSPVDFKQSQSEEIPPIQSSTSPPLSLLPLAPPSSPPVSSVVPVSVAAAAPIIPDPTPTIPTPIRSLAPIPAPVPAPALPPAPAVPKSDQAICCICKVIKSQNDFTKNQWRKKSSHTSKCQDCLHRGG